MAANKFCSKCGLEVLSGMQLCPRCGNRRFGQSPRPLTPDQPPAPTSVVVTDSISHPLSKKAKARVSFGILFLLIAGFTELGVVRDLVIVYRWLDFDHGPLRSYIITRNLIYAIFDGLILLVFLSLGLWLSRPLLQRPRANTILISVAVLVAILSYFISPGKPAPIRFP